VFSPIQADVVPALAGFHCESEIVFTFDAQLVWGNTEAAYTLP